MQIKEGILLEKHSEILTFENENESDPGLYSTISASILKNNSTQAKVKIESKDGCVTITRIALWGFDEEKQEFCWIEG